MTATVSRLLQPFVNANIFDFWASRLKPTWTWQRVLAVVTARKTEAKDTVTLLLQPNRHFEGFKAGQHVSVTVEVNGLRLTRSYSLSGIPRADGQLAITIKRVVGGKVSEFLTQQLAIGDVVELSQAFGDLRLTPQAEGQYLLLAAGSGITPLMSLLRHAQQSTVNFSLTLAYWVKNRADVCFSQELQTLVQQDQRFRVQVMLTQEPILVANELSGRLSAQWLAQHIAHLNQQQVYVCGSADFVATAHQLLAHRVLAVQSEAFTPPVIENQLTPQQVNVTLASTGRVVTISNQKPLLQALEEQGLRPASGCRMGICHTCTCQKVAGTTHDLTSGALHNEANRPVRLCVTSAASDLTLDL